MSYKSVHNIMTGILGMKCITARLVPKDSILSKKSKDKADRGRQF